MTLFGEAAKRSSSVLILVLLECIVTYTPQELQGMVLSLNPCFIGMYRDSSITLDEKQLYRLNPCFIGMYRDWKNPSQTMRPTSLNPCFIGMYRDYTKTMKVVQEHSVLILVLLECIVTSMAAVFMKVNHNVLILVLLECIVTALVLSIAITGSHVLILVLLECIVTSS